MTESKGFREKETNNKAKQKWELYNRLRIESNQFMPLSFLNINIFKPKYTKEGIKMSLVLSEDFFKKESFKQSLGVTEPRV